MLFLALAHDYFILNYFSVVYRFAFAEVGHLWRWWKTRNETMREILRKLVIEGRFEIVGGGWSQPDEAITVCKFYNLKIF